MVAKLENLLLNTPEAYYWMGFLCADGHFSNDTRIVLTINEKDRNHLEKFAQFIDLDSQIRSYKDGRVIVAAMKTSVVPQITKKFSINQNKTKYPPKSLPKGDDDLVFSFIVGFIDGDGCICRLKNRPDCSLKVKVHSSWLKILKQMCKILYEVGDTKPNLARLNTQGYAAFEITNSVVLKAGKRKAIDLRLPFLKRKWDTIDLNFVSQQELSQTRIKETKKLLSDGWRNIDIAEKLGIGKSAVTQMIQRNNFERFRNA